MSNIDFQNGFALGLASGGIVETGGETPFSWEETVTFEDIGGAGMGLCTDLSTIMTGKTYILFVDGTPMYIANIGAEEGSEGYYEWYTPQGELIGGHIITSDGHLLLSTVYTEGTHTIKLTEIT